MVGRVCGNVGTRGGTRHVARDRRVNSTPQTRMWDQWQQQGCQTHGSSRGSAQAERGRNTARGRCVWQRHAQSAVVCPSSNTSRVSAEPP